MFIDKFQSEVARVAKKYLLRWDPKAEFVDMGPFRQNSFWKSRKEIWYT